MLEAVVLAAGYSSRTGKNKMLLPYGESTIIESLLKVLSPYCNRMIIVTGYYHQELVNHLVDYPVEFVFNNQYPLGMFSSVQKGVALTTEDFLITPGDYPKIKPSTIAKLADATGLITVPTYGGRRGHPIRMSKQLKTALLAQAIDSNLKEFRNQHSIDYISVEDEGILMDVDTIKDYEKLRKTKKNK